MNYRRLGNSTIKVSSIVLGTMNFGGRTDEKESLKIIFDAFDNGINTFDCANVYSDGMSEVILGKAIKKINQRDKMIITSKGFFPPKHDPTRKGNTKKNIIASCEESLNRMKTDYIDIYFLHRCDFQTPIDETLLALDTLIQQGKIRFIGCSSFPAWKTVEALFTAEKINTPKFICEQPPYNILDRRSENEIFPMCRSYGMGILTWSPLAQGLLAGRYRKANKIPSDSRAGEKKIFAERITDNGINVAGKLQDYLAGRDYSLAQFSVAWVLKCNDVTSVIIGPGTLQQWDELKKSDKVVIDQSDLDYCDSLVGPGRFVSNHFNTSGWMK